MGHEHDEASDRSYTRTQPPPSGVIAPAPAPVPGRQTRVPAQPAAPQVVRPRGAGGSRLVEPTPTVTVRPAGTPDPIRRTEVLRRLGQMTARIGRIFEAFEGR